MNIPYELALQAGLCYNLSRNIVGLVGAENTALALINLYRRSIVNTVSPHAHEGNTPLKHCSSCPEGQQWHPATTEFFHRNRSAKDGLNSLCKACRCKNKSAYERLLAKLDTSGGTNACWLWAGSKDGKGYGMIYTIGKSIKTHRFMWEYTFGPIPDGLLVCHSCDNPPCCNPNHLWLGTNQDNMDDMVTKGRSVGNSARGDEHYTRSQPEKTARGERQGNAKLTEMQVREIRAKYATGKYTQTCLAQSYAVHQSVIGRIVTGKTWGHIMSEGNGRKLVMIRGER